MRFLIHACIFFLKSKDSHSNIVRGCKARLSCKKNERKYYFIDEITQLVLQVQCSLSCSAMAQTDYRRRENHKLILQDTIEDQLRVLFQCDLSPAAPMVMSGPNLLWRK